MNVQFIENGGPFGLLIERLGLVLQVCHGLHSATGQVKEKEEGNVILEETEAGFPAVTLPG